MFYANYNYMFSVMPQHSNCPISLQLARGKLYARSGRVLALSLSFSVAYVCFIAYDIVLCFPMYVFIRFIP